MLRSAAYVLGPLIALGFSLFVWALALPACEAGGLARLLGYRACSPAATQSGDAARESARAADLRAELARLQEELHGMQDCPVTSAFTPAPETLPSAESPQTAGLSEDDAQRLRDGDTTPMEGCWRLTSDLQLRNVANGDVQQVASWRMCFDPSGAGEQSFELTSGARCDSDVRLEAGGEADMTIYDVGDIPCNTGFRIFQRRIACRIGAQGIATCVSTSSHDQGETFDQGETNVTIRREGS